jgi:hypothetical protein
MMDRAQVLDSISKVSIIIFTIKERGCFFNRARRRQLRTTTEYSCVGTGPTLSHTLLLDRSQSGSTWDLYVKE